MRPVRIRISASSQAVLAPLARKLGFAPIKVQGGAPAPAGFYFVYVGSQGERS